MSLAKGQGNAADYLARRRKFPSGTFGSVFICQIMV